MQVIQRIEERIARISFLPVENGEGLQVLRYEVRCCAPCGCAICIPDLLNEAPDRLCADEPAVCCAQIGQIMLVMPNAFSKMGFSAAFPISIVMGCFSVYTAFLLVALYCERKARLVRPLE